MDEKRISEIIERVMARIREETAAPLPAAYVMLPRDWRAGSRERCMEALGALRGAYRPAAVLPEGEEDGEALRDAGIGVVRRGEAELPAGECVTVFPIPSRGLVVKTALCLEDDFESSWVAGCIARGIPVYMQSESPLFTGKETKAYQKRIRSYYRDAGEYGILFDAFPPGCGESRQGACDRAQSKRIVTTEDLEGLQATGELLLRRGDIVTALAAERAEELGIRIQYR